MADKVAALIFRISADTKALLQGFKQAQKSVGQVQSAMKALGGVMLATFSTRAVINFGKEILTLAGQAQGVKEAFDKLSNAPQLLDDMREATRGTVTELQLMQYAVRADNFKIPLTNLATFFEFATKRAAQTGESVDYLVDSIIRGIGRKSALVFDNVGVSVTEMQAEFKKMGDFGAAAGVIISRELEKMGVVTKTLDQEVQTFKVNIDNMKTSMGLAVEETGNLTEKMGELNSVMSSIDWDKVFKGIGTGVSFMGEAMQRVLPFVSQLASQLSNVMALAGALAPKKDATLPTRAGLGVPNLSGNIKPVPQTLAEWKAGLTDEQKKAFKESSDLFKKEQDLLEYQAYTWIQFQQSIGESMDKLMGKQLEWYTVLEEEEEVLDGSQKVIEEYTKNQEKIKDKLASVANSIASAFVEMSDSITTAFANLVTGDTGIEGFLNNILKMIADFAVSFGKMLTAIGIGLSLIGGVGAPLVAAGIALMTLGKIAGNLIARSSAGSGGGGYGSATRGYAVANMTGGQKMNVEVTGVLKGSDIYLSQSNYMRGKVRM
ncbi:MAG: hypothetical protein KKC77_19715 [Proteobacteria bacterium]|nr:hypothetical protein [Pseudomonadota bacterium]